MNIDPGTNDIQVDEHITEDVSSFVNYEFTVRLKNSRLTPEQRAAFHKMMIKAARQARISAMFALPDPNFSSVELVRRSSATGNERIVFFEE